MSSRIPAVVVGLCSHGLAICRSLGRRGIPVFALESNPAAPGWHTRYTVPCQAANVNGVELVEDLIKMAGRLEEKPVLFLTNDNMVRTVASHFNEIAPLYRLNWPAPELVLRLLDKTYLASFVRASGLQYPISFTVSRIEELEPLRKKIRYPVAVKPTLPLSPFKALHAHDEAELRWTINLYQGHVERFLIQEWVPGSERSIYFVNLYYNQERQPIARFVGRKIRAYPRATGAACSAEPCDRSDLIEAALRFFGSLPIRGPAALEIKEDCQGHQFVIEPTIGRTEYLVLCSIRNGVDIPYLAYTSQTGMRVMPSSRSSKQVVWVDWERDLPVYLESWTDKDERRLAPQFLFKPKVFALWTADDMKPSLMAWPTGLKRYSRRLVHRLRRLARLT